MASDVFNIEFAHFDPVIDGILEPAWLGVHEMNPSHYIQEDVSETFEQQIDWTDNWFTTRTLWDDDYLYIFVEAYDDVLSTTNASPWENDNCELYFDGDNSKHVGNNHNVFDSNDFQYRKEINGNESGDNLHPDAYGFQETDKGWNMEFAFDLDMLEIPPEDGHLFGYDVQKGDNDDTRRSSIVRWWDTGHESWLNPSLFGTAKLTRLSSSNVDPVFQPEDFVLEQNFPNPFNPQTTIAYTLGTPAHVQLRVFDIQGRCVDVLVNENQLSGSHQERFNGNQLTSGVYCYELNIGNKRIMKKMMLLR